jgi:hypothetical protein
LTLSHNYPGLWLGGGFLAFLGANFLYMGVRFAIAPPEASPNRGPEGFPVAVPLLIGGAVFLGLGALLVWLAFRWSERFDVDDGGITWHKGGREQAHLRWDEIRHVQLQNAFGHLVVEGPVGIPPLEINKGYKNVDDFLERLEAEVDWETLVRGHAPVAAPGPREELPIVPPLAAPPPTRNLPLVRNRPLPFWMSVAVTALLAALSGILLYFPATAAKPNVADPDARKKAEDEAADENVLRYGTPFLCLLTGSFIFTTWRQFHVDGPGIELRYFLRSRRWDWRELASVCVRIRSVGTDSYEAHAHALVITFRAGKQLTLAFGNESFEFRDAMVAAAARQGVTLRTDS